MEASSKTEQVKSAAPTRAANWADMDNEDDEDQEIGVQQQQQQ